MTTAIIFHEEATFAARRVRTQIMRKRRQIAELRAATEAKRQRIEGMMQQVMDEVRDRFGAEEIH